MDLQQRTKRFGWYVILCACVLRLIAAGAPQMLLRLSDLKTSFPTYSETGRNVRFLPSSETFSAHFRESPPPQIPEQPKPRFEAADAAQVEVDYDCTLRPDLEKLMERPLGWELRGALPTVLILHTHSTESYTKAGEDYAETARYRTLDERYNMLSIGEAVARILQENGIGVIHDREVHDYPSYNGSYVHARKRMEEILKENPSIQLVLDLHRDALEKNGKQLRPLVQVDGASSAQLMLVVGTNISRQSHENWEDNLALALKFHAQLQRSCPGIMRPLNLRSQRFNQDLHPGTLLVEVGTAGNSHAEALLAAKKLADAVVSLADGSDPENNVITGR